MHTPSIDDYGLLSDSHGSALVSTGGSIDWLCFDRFDASPVFSGILDDDAGRFSIAPADGTPTVQRGYAGNSLVLETIFTTPTGELVLEDALAIVPGSGHDLGKEIPRALVRRATCRRGSVEVEVDHAPRPEFGLVRPAVWGDPGVVRARGGATRLVLSSPVSFSISSDRARASFRLAAGDHATFVLMHRWSWEDPASPVPPGEADAMLDGTIEAWRSWSDAHELYQGPYQDMIRESGRVLQGLTFQPTGAIVAAPTTSLPEAIGAGRNWDYRYAWIRDASFTLQALYRSTCPDEAHRFFSWIAGATAASLHGGDELQIMFGVGGEHDLSERTLPHLAGYRGSRPVRVGNAAWQQRQLDVYGELLDAAATYLDQFSHLDERTTHFLADVADVAAIRWTEPDEGIWEIRGEPRHFVYSKLMCWVALDRAIALADRLGATDRVADWTRTRSQVRHAIEQEGWSDAAGSFSQAFGSDDLDASALMIPLVGFLPPDEPRVLATIEAIAEHLTDERGLVYRYRTPDGLEGTEGTFLLCTFWLAQARAMADQVQEAKTIFDLATSYRNDLGLLSEEVDARTGEALGNFPQAFSHVGLINAAWAIVEAERRASA
jgi:alpha,alpha-trehalase